MGKNIILETEILSIFEEARKLAENQQSKFFFSTKPEVTIETTPATTTTSTTSTTTGTPIDEDSNIKDSIKQVVQKVVDSMKDVVDTIKSKPLSVTSIKAIFAGIIDGVKKTLNEAGISLPNKEEATTEATMPKPEPEVDNSGLSFFAKWPLVCKALWFPYDAEKCRSARCMACAPSMMASATVCRKTEGSVSQRCLAATLGEGFCNSCVGDYTEYH